MTIETQKKKLEDIEYLAKISSKINELSDIETQLKDPNIWQDLKLSQKLNQRKTFLEKIINNFQNLQKELQNLSEIIEFSIKENNSDFLKETEKYLEKLEIEIDQLHISSMFTAENDELNCFLEINTGAGGTDSQDWAEMLLRMYQMWAEKHNFNTEIIEISKGEEAGIKSATLNIKGQFAYGWLKNENGTHRLVRISPFNSNGKRQTSFVGIFCYPEINDNINIDIKKDDLRIDVFRSSGAGGQHVNTTESAVRIVHLPTGITVESQTQRSQIQNRENAMKVLKSRLYEFEERKKQSEKQTIEESKTDISWGNQIRNYILHPYKLVKDVRSNFEVGNAESVLNGELDKIIYSVLKIKSEKN